MGFVVVLAYFWQRSEAGVVWGNVGFAPVTWDW